ncbi:T9SS sorting signal type C domain-containing protein [Flavobacterium sp. RHBU_24]|uniref:T9SS sorting signal type C domain-containing protein n=1 Tax=Flavobacterium sp. RHBU_24 TaxID=3391185 RepID=UPI003984AA1F
MKIITPMFKWHFTILVLCALFLKSSLLSAQATIDHQTFSGNAIPAGWTATNVAPSSGYVSFTAVNASLTSPSYNLSGFNSVSLTFELANTGIENGGPLTVSISGDGGLTWTAQTFNSATPSGTTFAVNGPIAITVPGTAVKINFTRLGGTGPLKFRQFNLQGVYEPVLSLSGSLTEDTLNNSVIVAELSAGHFAPVLDQSLFSLSGAPAGTFIASVIRNSDIKATITLGYNGTDFDTNANLGISAAASQFAQNIAVSSANTLPLTAHVETISATPLIRNGLNYYTGAGPSLAKSFTITATSLAPGSGTLSIIGNTHYEVSTTSPSSGFATNGSINFNNNTLAATTFYVRLKAGLAEGDYTNEAIAISGGKALLLVVANGKVLGNTATNDLCANQESLDVTDAAVAGTLTGATYTAITGGDGNPDVWYRFNATCAGTYTIALSGFSGDANLYLFQGSCPSSAASAVASAQTANATETIEYLITQPGFYYIRVAAADVAAQGAFSISLSKPDEAPYASQVSLSAITLNSVTITGVPQIACGTTTYGVEYSTVSNFTPGTGTSVAGGALTGGAYTILLNGLANDTTYYIRGWEQNATGTGYTTEQQFTTLQPVLGSYAVAPPVGQPAANAAMSGFTSKWFKDGEHNFVVNVSTSPAFDTTVFSEGFSGFSGDGTTEITAPDTFFGQAGWDVLNTYEANDRALVGSTGQNGYIASPAIDLSGTGDTFISFDVQKFENQNTVVQFLYDANGDGNWVQLGADIALLPQVQVFSFAITGGTATSKFKIQSASAAPGKRFYAGNIAVKRFSGTSQYIDYATAQATAQASTLNSINGYIYSKAQSGLTAGTTYYYRVRAEAQGIYSLPSETITVSTLTANIQGGRLYVKKGGAGTGESWASAIGEVAEALHYAKTLNALAAGTVKEIWVAGGKYRPFYTADTDSNANPDDRNNAFVLLNGVSLYGGFNGTETSLDARMNMPAAGNGLETVLTGKIGTDSDSDNTYHIVIATDITDAETVLDGFVIRDGRATGTGEIVSNGVTIPQHSGAGIYNHNSNYKLKNILLEYNIADSTGGAVYNIQSGAALAFKSIEITANQAAVGAGVANIGASPVFNDVLIKSNIATTYGGGLFNSNSSAALKDVRILLNSAQKGAGVYSQLSTSNIFTNVSISNNTATLFGGGIYIESDTAAEYKGADVFTNCIFNTNTAGEKGGAIYYYNGAGSIGNEGPVFTNSTFSGNGATTQANFLYYEYSAASVTAMQFRNSIIINPQTGSFIAGSANSGIDQMVFQKVLTNQLHLGTNFNSGNNQFSADPLFTDADAGDFTLTPESPAINRGAAEYYNAGILPNLHAITFDYNNNDRIYDGIIDMGAYEWQGYQPCEQTTTWNGNEWSNGEPSTEYSAILEADYTTSGNLVACSLYVNSGTLTILQGHTFTVKNEVNVAEGAAMYVQNNAALVQVNGEQNSGVAHVYRNSNPLFRLDYTLWSSPVSGQYLRTFSMATSNNRFYEYKYDYNGTGWVEGYWPVDPVTTQFEAAKSYLIRMPNVLDVPGYNEGQTAVPFAGDFAGTPNNGTISVPLSTENNRYSAVGNPYPSPISIAAFYAANTAALQDGAALYFWRKRNNGEATSYATITLSGFVANPAIGGGSEQAGYFTGPSSNWVLSPGQGFIVQSNGNAASPVLVFNNTMRRNAANSQAFLRQAPTQASRWWLNITAQNGTAASQMEVAYQDEGTLGLDYGYDGKLIGESNTLKLYSFVQNTPLAIQARPGFDSADVVQLGYTAAAAGEYTIAIDHVDGVFAEGQQIYLKDNVTGTITEILENAYTFTTEAGTFEGRFEVHYQASALGAGTPFIDAASVIVYQNGDIVTVNAGDTLINAVTVYDIRGRQLYSHDSINTTEISIHNLAAAHQVLIIEIATEKGKISKRIVY